MPSPSSATLQVDLPPIFPHDQVLPEHSGSYGMYLSPLDDVRHSIRPIRGHHSGALSAGHSPTFTSRSTSYQGPHWADWTPPTHTQTQRRARSSSHGRSRSDTHHPYIRPHGSEAQFVPFQDDPLYPPSPAPALRFPGDLDIHVLGPHIQLDTGIFGGFEGAVGGSRDEWDWAVEFRRGSGPGSGQTSSSGRGGGQGLETHLQRGTSLFPLPLQPILASACSRLSLPRL
ncbi:hypothetical protein BDV98DRAFT_204152 [Pterulicium gracile]|uniref:Uncharacterized protein n=1 Tax=Pterulicium gracile TaxID=1884261 RepID=A0A5C3Q8W8_9AGAR|nr:hypothetical protein BDV98DRAFT_204152 [Pterula gracilis]